MAATLPQPTLTPAEFAERWRGVTATEKAASQSHFIDLCRMLGEPTPLEADPTGEHYAFERRVEKAGGGDGFADVWKRAFFAWEYKGPRKDLKAAYVQLLNYKDDLGNPPLLIVSDLDRIEIRTNFTSLSPVLTVITLDDLAADDPSTALQQLRDVFTAPEAFRPHLVPAQITEQAARHFAEIAQGLRARGHDPEQVAHFLDRILFCLFAEDAGLLPKGIFSRLSEASRGRSDVFTQALGELFAKMASDGGLRDRGDRLVQRRPVRLRRRPPAHRLRDHHPARGQPAQLGAHRARDLRHPVRARPGPRPARATRSRSPPSQGRLQSPGSTEWRPRHAPQTRSGDSRHARAPAGGPHMTTHGSTHVRIRAVHFRNVKKLSNFRLTLDAMNVAVGPNNAGKSTIIGAFRVLAAGITTARAKSPERIGSGRRIGWRIIDSQIPMSMENIHTDYASVDSTVLFDLSNGNQLELQFASAGGAVLFLGRDSKQVTKPTEFRANYPIAISVVPELGPLEHEEEIVLEETVRRNLDSHRASRHFRNFWRYYPDGFDRFRESLRRTWPGTDIEPPRLENPVDTKLTMFAREGAFLRELYWAGFGFQVWCQLLTHLSRAGGASLLLVDEPETYLHPVLQRQILHLLREAPPDVLLATHSSEIIAEAEPAEVVFIDPTRRSGRRAADMAGVQLAMSNIGSTRLVDLTQVARTGNVLLVEGEDFGQVRAFARALGLAGLATGSRIAVLPLEGFPTPERMRSICEGIRRSVGKRAYIAAVFDRDYRCEDELDALARDFARHADKVLILRQHEIENYLLVPSLVQRTLDRLAGRSRRRPAPLDAELLLQTVTDSLRGEIVAARGAERHRYLRHAGVSVLAANRAAAAEVDKAWPDLNERIALAPGKEVLSELNKLIQPQRVIVSVQSLAADMLAADVAPHLAIFLRAVESRIGGSAG